MTGAGPKFAPGSLTLDGTSSGIVDAAGNHVLDVTVLAIAAGAKLDLNDNGLILDYTGTSPLATIAGYLKTAFNAGSWNGNGIVSTVAHNDANLRHGLGYAEASSLGVTSFLGQTVDTTSVLVRYTEYGDNTLDGVVDVGNDFGLLLDGLSHHSTGWINGDYNYDGKVDLGNDFNLFLWNYLADRLPAAPSVAPASAQAAAENVVIAVPAASLRLGGGFFAGGDEPLY